MLRYIVLRSVPYEGWDRVYEEGDEADPLPTFPSYESANEYAKDKGLISPKGRRNEAEILTIEVPNA